MIKKKKTVYLSELTSAKNEKDVENTYKRFFKKIIKESSITSPHSTDGILEYTHDDVNVKVLCEFKKNKDLSNRDEEMLVLAQTLFYLNTIQNSGETLPPVIFIADKNECMVYKTNLIIQYLKMNGIDWSLPPSGVNDHSRPLVEALINDQNLKYYTFYTIGSDFELNDVVNNFNQIATGKEKVKTKISKLNMQIVFDKFDNEVLRNKKSSPVLIDDKVNLFLQLIMDPDAVVLNKKKNYLIFTDSNGNSKTINIKTDDYFNFFNDYEQYDYTPLEKQTLLSNKDILVEDEKRRSRGEFFTPSIWVNEAHKLISETFGENWKDEYVVWDCAWGTGNLTRDYKFKELYCSTLEAGDIITANALNINPEANKFQFDFLNDDDTKLPQSLRDALDGKDNKKVIFLINPPYGRSGSGRSNIIKETATNIKNNIISTFGSLNELYLQFLSKIWFYNKNNNINLCIYTPASYKTTTSFKTFRKHFFKKFQFNKGFMFNASEFSDVKNSWPIDFSIWIPGTQSENSFNLTFKKVNNSMNIYDINTLCLYNMDNTSKLSSWIKSEKNHKDFPQLSSFNGVKNNKDGRGLPDGHFGCFATSGNNISKNTTTCYIITAGPSGPCKATFINKQNLLKVCTTFSAKKSILPTSYNSKYEYYQPNESHPKFEQFSIDSIVYSLFNNSSQQSSLRQVTYNKKLWDIKNEFFWRSKDDMQTLANENKFDKMFNDARTDSNRHVYNILHDEKDGLYNKLSPDAKELLDLSNNLITKSMIKRKEMDEQNPEFHLFAWDAGYAQLKNVWKLHFKQDFNEFREKYNKFSARMAELVYELGFLEKSVMFENMNKEVEDEIDCETVEENECESFESILE